MGRLSKGRMWLDETVRGLEVVLGGGQGVGDVRVPPGRNRRLKPEDTSATYILHAVLVHSGDNHGGHYVVYINPKNDGKWCKFDDDVVSRCTRNEAIEQNYGGHDNDLNIRHSSNAYMLVFVCKFTIHEVLEDVKSIDISNELQERLDEQRRTKFMNINVLLEDYTEIYQKSDLFNPATATYRTFKVRKSQRSWP
ncbi:hypothetical protein quinque_013971 [Culex quinquefasciatus]